MSRPEVETRAPTPADIDALVAGMRQQDIDEMHALGHTDLRAVVQKGVDTSTWSLTALVDGQVACIFGVAPVGTMLDPRGVPWMLGTELVPQNRRALARLAPGYIRTMLRDYPHLLNLVHAHNTVAVSWLKRIGFALHPIHDQNGQPFHLFEMRNV